MGQLRKMAVPSDARSVRPLVGSRHDGDPRHRSSGEDAVCGVAADPRARVRPVSLAGRDRRHARPAEHSPGRRLRARRRDRRRDGAERRPLSRRGRRARARRARAGDASATRASSAAACARRGDRRCACRAPTPARCIRGHGRLDSRPLHCRPARTRAPRDRTRAAPGWAAAVHRTCARQLPVPRGVPGPPARAVAPLRRRLSLQPPHCGAHARLRLRCRSRRRRRGAACRRSSARSRWAGRHGKIRL